MGQLNSSPLELNCTIMPSPKENLKTIASIATELSRLPNEQLEWLSGRIRKLEADISMLDVDAADGPWRDDG